MIENQKAVDGRAWSWLHFWCWVASGNSLSTTPFGIFITTLEVKQQKSDAEGGKSFSFRKRIDKYSFGEYRSSVAYGHH